VCVLLKYGIFKEFIPKDLVVSFLVVFAFLKLALQIELLLCLRGRGSISSILPQG